MVPFDTGPLSAKDTSLVSMDSSAVLIGSESLVLCLAQVIRFSSAAVPASVGGDELYPLIEVVLYLVPNAVTP